VNNKYIKIFFVIIVIISKSILLKAQHDADSLTNILLIYNLDDNFNKKDVKLSDSSAFTFHIISNEDKNSILSSNLGNLGSANISDIFIKREDDFKQDFSFNSPYYLFIKDSRSVNYYDTRRPFTSAMHSTSFKVNNIQTLKFTHTQNINPNFNIAADFDYTTSLGLYISQKTSINSSSVSLNYKKDKYSIYASYIRNKIENENSGGYIDTVGSVQIFKEGLMKGVKILIKNQELSATQYYNFGSYKNISYNDSIIKILEARTSISHNISFYQKYRVYNDVEVMGSKLPNPSFFYQEGETSDSTSLLGMSNKFRYASEKLFEEEHKFKFSLILNADLKKYYNFKDYIILENDKLFFENSLSTNVSTNKYFNLKTSLFAQYYFSGYRRNDFRATLNIFKTIDKTKPININFQTTFSYFKPDFFVLNYYSNHYKWENDFENSKRADANLTINIPTYKTTLTLAGSAINNKIYYGTISEALQYDSTLYVFTASLEKNFKLNIFYIKNIIYWQKSTKENIISLPELAAYHSSFIKLDLKSNSSFFFGYEVHYSTKYKAKSFNPSIGHFYQENIDAPTIGNYPFIALFFNMRIKNNVLLSFKYQHLNYNLMQVQNPMQINHYPVYGRVFRFAVRWTFKN